MVYFEVDLEGICYPLLVLPLRRLTLDPNKLVAFLSNLVDSLHTINSGGLLIRGYITQLPKAVRVVCGTCTDS